MTDTTAGLQAFISVMQAMNLRLGLRGLRRNQTLKHSNSTLMNQLNAGPSMASTRDAQGIPHQEVSSATHFEGFPLPLSQVTLRIGIRNSGGVP